MQVVHRNIRFNINDVMAEEVPFMNNFYRYNGELNADVRDLMAFPIANSDSMPFYTIKDSTTRRLNKQFEQFYAMMIEALEVAFADDELLYKFFDCSFLREHGKAFVPFARASYNLRWNRNKALYGRFDACFDPETEELLGIYEFNGDTPVMLFESVNLQNRYSQTLGTDQYNNWWDISMQEHAQGGGKYAVVCGMDYIEDIATCETVAQMLHESNHNRKVSFLDLRELDFDHANIKKPFVARGTDDYFDAMYILSPWEEMVSNFPTMLDSWERWIDNVQFFEPAWRWFMSNKGMMALCWDLLLRDDGFRERHVMCKILPTWLSSDMDNLRKSGNWVEKPVIGRLSNNIKVWSGGELAHDTGGYYAEENTVFQVYCAPCKVPGRNNFILGMWMSGSHSASMCAREFDTEVLSISNERFIPHIVVEG